MVQYTTRRMFSGIDRMTSGIIRGPALVVARDLRIRWAGASAADLFRSSPEELRGRPLGDFVEAVSGADDYAARIRGAVAERRVLYADDLFRLRGDRRPLGVWVVPVFCVLRSSGALLLIHDLGALETVRRELAERSGELSRRTEERDRALTELAQVRDDLAYHQDQLVAVFDGLDEGVIVYEPESRTVLFANRRFRDMFGGTESEAARTAAGVGDRGAGGAPGDADVSAVHVSEWHDALRNRRYRRAICTIRWPDGRWVRFARVADVTGVHAVPPTDAGVSPSIPRSVFDLAAVPMAVVDPVTGEIKEVNRRLELLTGIPAAQLVRTTWPALLDASSAARSCDVRETGNLRVFPDTDSSAGTLFGEPFITGLRDAQGCTHRVRVSVAADERRRTAVVTFEQLSDADTTHQRRAQAPARSNRILSQAVNALSSIVEGKDTFTAEHQRKVAVLACAIALELGMSARTIHTLRVAGLLHDIGKIHIPDAVLNKADRLDPSELHLIRTHPLRSYEIVRHLSFDDPVAEIVRQHHERLDGSGYPYGLCKDDILMETRILAVADVVEAMTARRPWREPPGNAAAVEELRTHRGTRYDPRVVDACVRILERESTPFS